VCRMLWISCLLISSVTCLPARKGNVGSLKNAHLPAGGSGSPAAAGGFGSPAAAGGFGNPAATGGSGSPAPVGPMHWSSASTNVDLEPTGNDASGVISASGNAGGGSVGTGLSSNSGSTGGEDGFVEEERPQPVFSNMSNMEPVYTFRSRSGYRNGRRHFSKTRYTPGEMVFPPRLTIHGGTSTLSGAG
uniref:Secreted protein n=1 Tax=Cyclopterus lumpus TaxID=8103 RepID=A0A8C2WT66_CYCLU